MMDRQDIPQVVPVPAGTLKFGDVFLHGGTGRFVRVTCAQTFMGRRDVAYYGSYGESGTMSFLPDAEVSILA